MTDPSVVRLIEVMDAASAGASTNSLRRIVLASEERAKTRCRAVLSDGSAALVMLPRGSAMRPGSRLVAETGELVEVVAAAEQVYRVSASPGAADPTFALLRAAYHLGNRHVPVELTPGILKLERDPVLRDLLLRLGMVVTPAFETFDPEPGAYGGGHRHAPNDETRDADGGAIGEALSRSAHAATIVADTRP